jgi:signal transduction histidine kinase
VPADPRRHRAAGTARLAARLRRHELFGEVDDTQLAWLVERGTVRRLADGEVLFRDGEPATMFVVLLDGELLITKVVDGREEVLTRHSARSPARPDSTVDVGKPSAAHGFTGEMPLLAGENYVADATAGGPTTVITYDQDSFLEMFARIPRVSRVLLPVLAWRIQSSQAVAGQRNTLQALGTLAAGLAHELNNPAAAVVRNSSALPRVLRRLEEACFRWSAASAAGGGAGGGAVRELVAAVPTPELPVDSVQRAAVEEELARWLADRALPRAGRLAGELADEGADLALLRRLERAAGAGDLSAAVEYTASLLAARGLAREIGEAGGRIASIIESVREYTNLDRAPQQDVDVASGLDATLAMLAPTLTGIRVVRRYDPRVPVIRGYPGELNQVWTNLIGNAVDALHGQGELRLTTRPQGAGVLVEIADTGTGIPASIVDRIFEPFFTTKDVGKGTGLGLHLSHRIVTQRHQGVMRVESEPGATRFTVRLPSGPSAGPDPAASPPAARPARVPGP